MQEQLMSALQDAILERAIQERHSDAWLEEQASRIDAWIEAVPVSYQERWNTLYLPPVVEGFFSGWEHPFSAIQKTEQREKRARDMSLLLDSLIQQRFDSHLSKVQARVALALRERLRANPPSASNGGEKYLAILEQEIEQWRFSERSTQEEVERYRKHEQRGDVSECDVMLRELRGCFIERSLASFFRATTVRDRNGEVCDGPSGGSHLLYPRELDGDFYGLSEWAIAYFKEGAQILESIRTEFFSASSILKSAEKLHQR